MALEVYVEAGCFGCHRALEIAAEMSRRFPTLAVSVIDIGETSGDLPEAVFAVPTYLLNGATVSLGNPDPEELASLIAASGRSHLAT